jgi:hypothetical protein
MDIRIETFHIFIDGQRVLPQRFFKHTSLRDRAKIIYGPKNYLPKTGSLLFSLSLTLPQTDLGSKSTRTDDDANFDRYP